MVLFCERWIRIQVKHSRIRNPGQQSTIPVMFDVTQACIILSLMNTWTFISVIDQILYIRQRQDQWRERESHRLRVWYRYLERERERKTEIEICLTLQLFGQGRHHGFQVGVGDARHEGVQVQGRRGFLVPLWRPRQRKIVKQCKRN